MMRAIAFALAAACALMMLGPQVYAMFGRALLTAGTSAPSAHPVAISPVVASVQDSTTANSILVPAGTWVVTMSDLSPFTGTITNPVGLGLTTMSGNNLVADRDYAAGDDGSHALTVCATQGATLCASFALSVNAAGAVACDAGPNLVSMPAPAVRAWGSDAHCGLNADFSIAGGTYSNTANFIASCGASNPAWPNGSQFFVNYFLSPQYVPNCDRTQIITDPIFGGQVLHLQYRAGTESQNGLNMGAPRNVAQFLELDWPAPQGYPGFVLPYEMYWQIVWRSTATSLNQASNANEALDFWNSPTNQHPDGSLIQEADLLEIFANQGNPNSFTGGAINFLRNQTCTYGGCDGFSWSFDFTSYHKMEWLVTSDGSTITGSCWWMDDTMVGCRTTDTGTGYRAQTLSIDFGGNSSNGNPGPCGNNPGDPDCVINDVNVYIKSMVYAACSNYKNGQCTGPIIQGPP